jgi:hypothetical protein
MSEGSVRELNWWEHYPLHKLWCNDLCPLVPRISTREKDDHNAWDASCHWLIFNVWTLSHFSLSFDAELSPSRIGFGFCIPYLRVWVGFAHMYGPVNGFFNRHLYRHGYKRWWEM